MNRTTSVLFLVVVLLAAVVGLGWLLRSEPPVGAIGVPHEPVDRPETNASAPLSGVPSEERTSLAATTEPSAPAAEPDLRSAEALWTPDPIDEAPNRRVLIALHTPAGEPFLEVSGIRFFSPNAIATSRPPHPTEPWSGTGFNCGGKSHVGADRKRGILGSIEVTCEPPVWVTLLHGARVVTTQQLEPEAREIVFVLDPVAMRQELCTVRFRAVDVGSGILIPGASVNVSSGNVGMTVESDGGEFVIEDLQPGRLQLALMAKDYAAAVSDHELEPGTDTDLGELPLDSLVRHRLRVMLRRPAGTTGAFLQCEPVDFFQGDFGPDRLGLWKKDAQPERDEVAIRLTEGRWCVWAEAAGPDGPLRSSQRIVTVAEGGNDTTLDLVRPVPVTLRGGPEPTRVLVRDENGLWATDMAHVDANAERKIALVPGTYELVVRAEGKDERVLPLQVRAQATEVDLR